MNLHSPQANWRMASASLAVEDNLRVGQEPRFHYAMMRLTSSRTWFAIVEKMIDDRMFVIVEKMMHHVPLYYFSRHYIIANVNRRTEATKW